MTFDDILRKIGSFGPFQKRVVALTSLPPLAQCAIVLAQVFIAGKSDHWCHVKHWQDEDCHQWNLTEEECVIFKRNISAPIIEGSRSQCLVYNLTGIDLESAFYQRAVLNQTDIISCNEGWEFDRSVFSSTITEEWELVCDKSGTTEVFQSITFAGYLFGSIVFGGMADRVGRYYTFMVCCVAAGVSSILTALAPNAYMFVVLRFIAASTSYGMTLMCFVIASEVVLPSLRVYTGVILWFFFSGGYLFLSAVASITRSWRVLLVIISSPYVLMILSFPFVCESPRWLIAKGKFKRARKLITKMAKTNKKEVPNDLQSMMEREKNKTATGTATVMELIRTPTLRYYMLNMMYSWFVQGFVFYGLALGTSDLGVNVYLAFCLSGAVEMPAHVLSIYTMKKCGRRASTSFWILLAGVACFGTIITPLGPWRVSVATVGKLAIATSFNNVYVYAGEILPTPLRSFGVGMCSVGARVGSIVAPLLLYLGTVFESLPLILFASSSILGGLLILLLPETNQKPLPDTIEDALNLRKKREISSVQYKNVADEDKDQADNSELD